MSESTMNNTMAANADHPAPTALRGWLEVLSVPVLLLVGAILGGATGIPILSPICAVALPLALVTVYLKRENQPWRTLVFGSTLNPGQVMLYTICAALGATGLAFVAMMFLQNVVGTPRVDVSVFAALEGNFAMYVTMMVLVAWGSAAIGEELLVRGFLMHRLGQLASRNVAIVLQALIFATAHFYQGITGVVSIFFFSLVFGAVYLRCGRNLLPVILAHGLVDTYALTVLYIGRPELLIGT